MAVAGDGHPLWRALFELVNARLGPQMRALRKRGLSGEDGKQRHGEGGRSCCGIEDAGRLGNKHAAVESTKVEGSVGVGWLHCCRADASRSTLGSAGSDYTGRSAERRVG